MLQSQFCEMGLNGKSGNVGSELPIGPLRLLKIKSNRIFEAYMRSNLIFEDNSEPRIENGNENYNKLSPSSNNKKRACPSTTNSSNNNNNNNNNNNSRLVKNSKGLQTTDRMKISSISTSSRSDFEDLSIDINEDNSLLQTGIRGTKRNTSVDFFLSEFRFFLSVFYFCLSELHFVLI